MPSVSGVVYRFFLFGRYRGQSGGAWRALKTSLMTQLQHRGFVSLLRHGMRHAFSEMRLLDLAFAQGTVE